MSEHDEGGGNWVWPFVLGVIVGILLMLGVGGVLMTKQFRDAAVERDLAEEAAARPRDMEMLARKQAEVARQAAENASAKTKRDVAERRTPAKKD
jgi:hypothetical protein